MTIALPTGTAAELVRPSDQPVGGLVIVPDIMGLRPLFADLAARLADDHDWVVCAPEPFPGEEHLDIDERLAAMASKSDQRMRADLAAAADATGCDRVAILGFCMGGMYTLKAAATDRFVAAVPFYGMIRLPENWRGPDQSEPLDAVTGSSTPILAIMGGKDHWTPPADVDALQAAGAQVVRYPEADHGFVHVPDRPAHRPGDAADAWARVLAFLTDHLSPA